MPPASVVVFVHGVGNRSESAFIDTVRPVVSSLGRALERDAFTVFWGDLAPSEAAPFESIPTRADATELPEVAGPEAAAEASTLLVAGVDSASLVDETLERVRSQSSQEPSAETERVVRDAVTEAQTEGAVLGSDLSEVLAEVVLLAPPIGSAAVAEGFVDNIKDTLKKIIKAVDRRVGRAVGDYAQDLLRNLQASLGGVFGQTLGDVLQYEASGTEIRGRLDEAYAKARSTGLPIDIVAHSLGGFISIEWLNGAPAARRDGGQTPPSERFVRNLVTFGTQVSLFAETHGVLRSDSTRVRSPEHAFDDLALHLDKWTNIWHQCDPLAFVMGRVFTFGGRAVQDRKLALKSIPKDLGFHSSYWKDPRFLAFLGAELR